MSTARLDKFTNYVTCVTCMAQKPKIPTGEFWESGKQVYRDETPKRWSGNQCPPCAETNKFNRLEYSASRKLKRKGPQRHCRKCNKKLPRERYFHCFKCGNVDAAQSDFVTYSVLSDVSAMYA